MVKILKRVNSDDGHYTYKCDFCNGMIKFFYLDNLLEDHISESTALYDRTQYEFLCEVESLEQFIQEQKLLQLLEE